MKSFYRTTPQSRVAVINGLSINQAAVTLLFAALVSVFLVLPLMGNAQSIVIGTGATTTDGTAADPVERYYRWEHFQMVWTAAELSAAGLPAGAEINSLGFSVSESAASLIDYTISMGHTANANASSHIAGGLSVVRTPFTYAPVVQTAGNFDMIAFTANFSWDGSSNIVVDICTGDNAFATPYGGLRVTTATNMTRYTRSDFADQCGQTTGSTTSNRPNVQFNYTVPTCLPASGLTASAVAATSATVSWTASTSNPSGGYQWEVRSSGIAGSGPTGLEDSGTTGAGVVTAGATGLPENTQLSLYVRADCGGGDYSSWVGPYDFTTLCSVGTIPYFEGFESSFTDQAEVAGCWSQQSLTGTQTWTANSSLTSFNRTPRTGSFNAYLRYGNDDWLFRDVQLTGGTSYTFEVYARQDGSNTANSNITLAYGTTASAAGMTNTVVSATGIDNNYQQITGTFTPATSGVYYIGIKGYMNGSPYYISLDDIRVYETPSCQPPTVGAATAVTASGATLNWTASPSNPTGGYQWEVRSSGVGGSGATGLEDSGTVGAGVVTANATGLAADQTYEVYVRSDCGGGSYSSWGGPVSFFTGYCDATPSSVDNDGITNVTFGQTSVVNNSTGTETNNYGYYVSMVGDGQQGTTLNVDITYETGYTYGTRIYVDWNDDLDFDDTGEDVYTGLSTSSNPTTLSASFLIPLTATIGNHRMRIGGTDNNSGPSACYNGAYGSIEDYTLEVTAAPTCFAPSNLTSSAVTNSTATISWDAASPAPSNGYQWEIRSSGAPGSGATGLEDSGTTAAGVLTDNATTLPGNTLLSLYVRGFCGGSDYSSWTAAYTFTTLCDPGSIPFSEGFESGYTHGSDIAGCWTQENNVGTWAWRANDTYTGFNAGPRTGSWSGYLQYGNNDWLFYPLTVVAGTQYTIDAYSRQNGTNTANATIELAYGASDDEASMTTVTSATGISDSYSLVTGTFTPVSSGTIYIGIKGYIAGAEWYLNLDDIAVYETPSCLPPTATAATDVSLTGATINWTASGSAPVTGYEWEVRSSGAGGSGATGLEDSGSTADAVLTDDATGLPSDQTLSVYVRADCGSNQSPWNGPITFYTGYCQPSPSSVDGIGITNVTFGVNNVVNNTTVAEANNYGDYSAQIGDGAAATTLSVDITYQTGYTYNTRIWVDWNDDLDFDDTDEMAYFGTSTSANPTTLNASISIPAGAVVGNHRMRIGGADGTLNANEWCDQGSYACFEDYTLEVTPAPTCFPPTITSATATSYTAADFAWTAASPAPINGYNWEVRSSGVGGSGVTGQEATGSVGAGVLTASASSLPSQATLQLWVRSNCGGGDYSTWDGPFEFVTDYCVAQTTSSTSSYVNQFNTSSTVIGNANINNTSTGYATDGYDDRTTEVVEMHETGSVDFTAGFVGTTVGFNIWIDWNNDLQFDLSERVYASGTYVSSATGTITVPASTANGDYRMRIRCNYNSTNPSACGDINRGETEDYVFRVVDPPACADPTVTAATGVTFTSADINWTASPSNPTDGYEWEVRSSGAGGSGATGLEASGTTAAGVVTDNVTGLTQANTYSVYVRSACGSGTFSAWDGPITFYTDYCDASPSSVDGSGITNITFGQTSIVNNTTGTETNNYGDYSAMIGDGQQGTSLTVDITYSTGYTYGTRIYVDWNNDLDFDDSGELVYTGLSSSSNPTTLSASFTIPVATPLGNYRMRIGGTDNNSGPNPCYTGSYGSTEDYTLQVTAAPTCFDPTVTAVTGISNNAATLNWNAASPAPSNGYQVEVRSSGAGGSGATGLEFSGLVAAGVLTTNATGLPSNTLLSVYVRSNCGGGDYSDWDGPVTFTTLCDPASVPFFEGFESGYTHETVVAGCWTQENVATAAESWEANDTYTSYNRSPRTGSWNAMLRYYSEDWLFYPLTLAGGTEYTFEVYARQDATSGFSMTLAYGTADNAAAMTNTVVASTPIVNGGYQQIVGTFTPPSNGVYYIGILGESASFSPWYLSIDDISVFPTPACQQPAAVSNPTVTSNTEATLNWLASPSTPTGGYEWEVRSSGAGGSGATGLEDSGSTAAGVLTDGATGLPPNSTLNVYVRANCGGGSFSPWAGPTSFYTGHCVPAPSSVDGQGITNVTFGQTSVVNNTTAAETGNYGDYSAMVGDGQQGTDVTVDIQFGHSLTYNTRIWVDWNNDLDFDDTGEEVFIGTSSGASNPHTQSATFTIPAATPLGNYRMRIGSRDFSPAPGPCYTGTWGAFEDYTLEVTPAPTCFAPTVDAVTDVALNSATLNWTAPTNVPSDGYTWEVRSSGLPGSGPVGLEASGTVAAGVLTDGAVGLPPLTDLFVYVRGFCGGGDYSSWAGPESFTTIPDECAQAATWPTIPIDGSCATVTVNTGAASQSQAACIGTANDDVWFEFTMPAGNNQINYSTSNISGSGDRVFQLWTACGGTSLYCNDSESGFFSGLTPGSTYVIRTYTYFNSASEFDLCLSVPPPPPANDECANAISIDCGETLAGSTVGAVSETPGTGCSVSQFGVWYKFTGNGYPTTIEVDADAGYDHELNIASGVCGSLSNIVCRDFAGSGGTETYTFTTTDGLDYYVYIAHYSSSSNTTGDFTITRSCSGFANWTGLVSSDWADAGNWSFGVVPGASDDAYIPTNPLGGFFPVIDETAEINSIFIEPAARVTITSGFSLEVNDQLDNDGIVTVQSGGSLVQVTGSTLTGAGVFNVHRDGSEVYDYWSSPVTVHPASGLQGAYQYEPSTGTADPADDEFDPGWVTATGNLTVGRGYAAHGVLQKTFSGTVNNGNQTVNVSYHALPNVAWNLIGNPYPSGITVSQFLTTNAGKLDVGAVYLWDDPNNGQYGSGDYAVRNASGGTAGGGGNTPTGILGTAQGFKVKVNATATTIDFTNAMRTTGNTSMLFRQAESKRLWLQATNLDGLYNQILVGFFEDATDGFDWAFDAPKLNSMSDLSLYSLLDGEPYAIQGYSPFYPERVVPLGMHIADQGPVTLSLEQLDGMEDDEIYLEDRYLGVYHDLQASGYDFDAEPGLYIDRFYLHFVPMSITGIDQVETSVFGAVMQDDILFVSSREDLTGSLEVLDMSGRVIWSRGNVTLNSQGTKFDMSSASDGVYIVRFAGAEGAQSKKVLK